MFSSGHYKFNLAFQWESILYKFMKNNLALTPFYIPTHTNRSDNIAQHNTRAVVFIRYGCHWYGEVEGKQHGHRIQARNRRSTINLPTHTKSQGNVLMAKFLSHTFVCQKIL
jgi:hypothetical protein